MDARAPMNDQGMERRFANLTNRYGRPAVRPVAALAALIFCGCAEDPEGARTVTGEYLGQAEKVEIDSAAGRLVMPAELLPIQSVVRNSYSGRVIETYDLKRGLVVLELAWEGGFRDYPTDAKFRRIFENWEIAGTLLPKSLSPNRKGRLTYAEFSYYTPCLAFSRPIGEPVLNVIGGNPSHEGTLYGFVNRDMVYTYFVETVTDLIAQIRLRE